MEVSLASLSLTHILTSVDIPRPFRFATAFNSSRVGSSSRNVNTRFFRNTKSSGLGRKSSTILPVSMGSSVYLIFLIIYFFPFFPVPCPDDPDPPLPFGEAYGHDTAFDLAKAKNRSSFSLWFRSSIIIRLGSAKAYWASKKDTPCFSLFCSFFKTSHSKFGAMWRMQYKRMSLSNSQGWGLLIVVIVVERGKVKGGWRAGDGEHRMGETTKKFVML